MFGRTDSMTGATHRLDRGTYDELVTVCVECAAADPELKALPRAAYLGVSRGEHRIVACEHPEHDAGAGGAGEESAR